MWRPCVSSLALNLHVLTCGVPWCSGYHVCFTRRRSRVRNSLEPVLFCHLIERSAVFTFFSMNMSLFRDFAGLLLSVRWFGWTNDYLKLHILNSFGLGPMGSDLRGEFWSKRIFSWILSVRNAVLTQVRC